MPTRLWSAFVFEQGMVRALMATLGTVSIHRVVLVLMVQEVIADTTQHSRQLLQASSRWAMHKTVLAMVVQRMEELKDTQVELTAPQDTLMTAKQVVPPTLSTLTIRPLGKCKVRTCMCIVFTLISDVGMAVA